ncbi:MAG: NAD(P)-binding protein [Acidobacteriaceae bacterium]|nr:NAD(P)-binding protein [Acidobacteriaceae bacterium]
MTKKIAVAGAGIYGATAASRLAEHGHKVELFDPLGIMRAASAINQYRVHAGYHYPRSPETIAEILEARGEFLEAFAPAIVKESRHFYAIPKQGSRTEPEAYERIMSQNGLPLKRCRPDWLDFGFIDACYEVQEHLYDPDILRSLIETRLRSLGVKFEQRAFSNEMRADYDCVVWAIYGMGPSRGLFQPAKYQIAEKILIDLPEALRRVALVVVDGPFTAFDPYGNSSQSLFGSAKHTNHWSSANDNGQIPERYAAILNAPEFEPVTFTHFEAMRADCSFAVPAAKDAIYRGSRFTIRVVEDNPEHDRRILHVLNGGPGEFHIFSGKVVSAVKAARILCDRIADHA